MPDYEGFPPDEVEALKEVCIDALFAQPSAIAGTRGFARAIMRAGWRRRPRVRLREVDRGPAAWASASGHLEVLGAGGEVELSVAILPMPREMWQLLGARLGAEHRRGGPFRVG